MRKFSIEVKESKAGKISFILECESIYNESYVKPTDLELFHTQKVLELLWDYIKKNTDIYDTTKLIVHKSNGEIKVI